MYHDLKKIFHRDSKSRADEVYQARFSDASACVVGLRENDPFFFWMAPDVYKKLLEIERLDKKVEQLVRALPRTAIDHYLKECLIDEIILTNEVEGVVSTRKQIQAALDALQKHDKRKRFQGIVRKYNALIDQQSIPVQSCEDLRALYDEIVLEEVVNADPRKAPDGILFRKDTVRVVNAADQIIHENSFSEERIYSELSKQLHFFHDPGLEQLFVRRSSILPLLIYILFMMETEERIGS